MSVTEVLGLCEGSGPGIKKVLQKAPGRYKSVTVGRPGDRRPYKAAKKGKGRRASSGAPSGPSGLSHERYRVERFRGRFGGHRLQHHADAGDRVQELRPRGIVPQLPAQPV